ncbi:MAG: flagellar hook-associated protein FlgK [Fusobacteriaceae bacterium]|jgi:flagellar hook-associated protein 1|nr:flagellar hook-associated protein FlgK [Fusobacteriaceae bacterium]MBP6467161.1 flagellar hook-associated protein FlgK [Fusobacteriaceae bacterium]MBU9917579.1 flagellar hook-associated protein FlgK [Fusobacteriaceae bacterium]
MSFNGLEVGKRSLSAHQQAMGVTGHNISSANKEGYSRQKVEMNTITNKHEKYGQVGIGAEVDEINRARDTFIDDRMMKEKSANAKWEIRDINIKNMEYIINEPSDQSIRKVLDEYWEAMQDLSQNPEDMSTRVSLRERAVALSNSVSSTYERFESLRTDFDQNIDVVANDINSSLRRLAEINGQVRRVEAGGAQANDLRDEFDLLVEKLSEMVNVKVSRKGSENAVSIGGRTVVQGDTFKEISVKREAKVNEGFAQLYWDDIDEPVLVQTGKLKGLLELRDEDAIKYMKYMDQLAIGLIDNTNDVNKAGFDFRGVQGGEFFETFETEAQIRDINGDKEDEAAVYKIRGNKAIEDTKRPLSITMQTETKTIGADGVTEEVSKVPFNETGSFEINNIIINYDTSKDSLEGIVEKINKGKTGVVASLDPNNRLVLRAEKDEDYVVKTISQSSGTFLSTMGIIKEGQNYNYKNTESLNNISEDRMGSPRDRAAFRMTVAINNVENIAAAKGTDTNGDGVADKPNPVGDGSNALKMAMLKSEKSIGRFTYEEFFKSIVSDLGISSQEAQKFLENQNILLNNLEQRRQATMGVSLDEEMAEMLKYQHGYDAAARYMKTVDDMISTVIEKL